MPRDFGGIIEEHNTVRSRAGVFDLSHMGRLVLRGTDVASQFQQTFSRNVVETDRGQALYGFLCDEDGGCIDDIIAYVRSDNELWLVVNAGNREEVVSWLTDKCSGLDLEDRTEKSVLLAIQGPDAPAWFDRLEIPSLPDKPFRADWSSDTMVASTGYTGEDGGEIWLPVPEGQDVFHRALEEDLTPCGLGARDTLRLEMGYPLHGHELSRDIDPVTANLEVFVDWDHEFLGRESLETKRNRGAHQTIRGVILDSRRSPDEGAAILNNDDPVGRVTSGRFSPTLEVGIGMGLIDRDCSIDVPLDIMIRDRPYEVDQITPPFI